MKHLVTTTYYTVNKPLWRLSYVGREYVQVTNSCDCITGISTNDGQCGRNHPAAVN
ncbi:hypothetical protein BADSM9389_11740 [Buttiauxella agrestis]|nr:hypothetical protein BADSM9389_11740 [Buttiauxella agrestis]